MRARVEICIGTVALAMAMTLGPAAAGGAGRASARVASSISAVPVRSSYETATRVLSRDIGVSVPLPDGHDLWLFGDTAVYTTDASGNWLNTGFVDGSTAFEGRTVRGAVPSGAEVPAHSPARFIPVPKNVYLPDGSKQLCLQPNSDAAFAARWPTGAAVLPSNTSEILVTYAEVCVTEPAGFGPLVRTEGWGYLLYNWRVHRIALGPIDVFRPHGNGSAIAQSHVFGWPVYVNGKLTLFSASCTAQYINCGGGNAWSVSTSTLSKPDSYHLVPMKTDGTSAWTPMSISVGKYTKGYRLIESTSIGGDYKILGTPKLGVPWHLIGAGTLPDCVANSVGYCHGIEGHPELSTSTDIFISYKDPNSGPGGHMVISAIPSG